MTKLVADQKCERCNGMLVPPEVQPPIITKVPDDPPDYVCAGCGQSYRWAGNPPTLVAV
jgi:uncharacterized protein with PIN domain